MCIPTDSLRPLSGRVSRMSMISFVGFLDPLGVWVRGNGAAGLAFVCRTFVSPSCSLSVSVVDMNRTGEGMICPACSRTLQEGPFEKTGHSCVYLS